MAGRGTSAAMALLCPAGRRRKRPVPIGSQPAPCTPLVVYVLLSGVCIASPLQSRLVQPVAPLRLPSAPVPPPPRSRRVGRGNYPAMRRQSTFLGCVEAGSHGSTWG
eukprot:1140775-Pyramimonas_sp.AAC.1